MCVCVWGGGLFVVVWGGIQPAGAGRPIIMLTEGGATDHRAGSWRGYVTVDDSFTMLINYTTKEESHCGKKRIAVSGLCHFVLRFTCTHTSPAVLLGDGAQMTKLRFDSLCFCFYTCSRFVPYILQVIETAVQGSNFPLPASLCPA